MAAPERVRERSGSSLLQRTASVVGGLGSRKVVVQVEGMTATLTLEPGACANEAIKNLIRRLTEQQEALAGQLSESRPRRGSLGGLLRVPSFGSSGGAGAAIVELPTLDTPLEAAKNIPEFLEFLLEQMTSERLEDPALYNASDFDTDSVLNVEYDGDRHRKLQEAIRGETQQKAGVIISQLIDAICRTLNLIPIAAIPDEERLPEGLHESRRTLLIKLLKHIKPIINDADTKQLRLFLFADLIFSLSGSLRQDANVPILLSQVLQKWVDLDEVTAV